MSSLQRSIQSPLFITVVVLILIGSALSAIALVRRPPPLDQSAIGFNGLNAWLNASGRDSRTFAGGGTFQADTIGLRILPLYDTDLDSTSLVMPVTSPEEQHLRADLRDLSKHTLAAKILDLPTLVIMPKWTDGVRLSGLTHYDFLAYGQSNLQRPGYPASDEREWSEDVEQLAESISLPVMLLPRAEEYTLQNVFLGERYNDPASLLAPQWMSLPAGCEAMIGTRQQALLARCHANKHPYWILSDPDLLNNHGLARGENAALALGLISSLSLDGEIVIDYSQKRWLNSDNNARPLSDLLRYFEPPLTWLWLAGVLTLLLVLWRAAIYPGARSGVLDNAHHAARITTIHTHARLMRQANKDGALVKALSALRFSQLQDRCGRATSKAGPDVIDEINSAMDALREAPDTLDLASAIALLDNLETAYEKARESE